VSPWSRTTILGMHRRVDAARANLGITRSNQFPNFGFGAAVPSTELSTTVNSRSAGIECIQPPAHVRRSVHQSASFEVDIWGRLRRATEAAQAELLRATGIAKP